MRFALLTTLFALAASSVSVDAHSRWKCPKARDWNDDKGVHIPFDNTGNKVGPCGPFSGKWGMGGNYTLAANSWQTLTWEESVTHGGAPFRISIVDENEIERVTLLDHIPHNEDSNPIPGLEFTYVPYSITVYIPDVQCEKCSLRLLYAMTDKTVNCGSKVCTYYPDDNNCSGHTDTSPACAGAPNNNPCKRADTCFSNYHSCVDVSLNGSIPLNQATFTQPNNWPYRSLPELQYGAEIGVWTNGWLDNVPGDYTIQQGQDLC